MINLLSLILETLGVSLTFISERNENTDETQRELYIEIHLEQTIKSLLILSFLTFIMYFLMKYFR